MGKNATDVRSNLNLPFHELITWCLLSEAVELFHSIICHNNGTVLRHALFEITWTIASRGDSSTNYAWTVANFVASNIREKKRFD